MYNYNNSMMGMPMMNGGMVYNQNVATPLMTNPLTAEQRKELEKNARTTSCPPVTQTEYFQSICTHRDPSKGAFTIQPDNDGNYYCTICHEKFSPVDYTEEQVKAITEDFLNVLQTTKMNFVDMSDNSVMEFFKMIPLVKRIPALYNQALNVVNKYDNGTMFNQQGNGNIFAMFSALTNPAYAMGAPAYNQMQQPMYGAQPQMYGGQPMYNGGGNPFVSDPQMMQQQMMQQQQMNMQPQMPNNVQVPNNQPQTSQQTAEQVNTTVGTVMNV